MKWLCFVDWLPMPEHLKALAGETLIITPDRGDHFVWEAYAQRLHGNAMRLSGRRDVSLLSELLQAHPGIKLAVSIDGSGLVTLALQDPRLDPEDRTNLDARFMALLAVNILACCFDAPERVVVDQAQDAKALVVPSTALWPIDVEPSETTKTHSPPEGIVAEYVMARALKGDLRALERARTELGWIPGARKRQPVLPLLISRGANLVDRHLQRMDGALREKERTRVDGEIDSTEALLHRLFGNVVAAALSLAVLWFSVIVSTWAFQGRAWFFLSFDDLWWWTVALSVALSGLIYSMFSLYRAPPATLSQLPILFGAPWHLWSVPAGLTALAIALAIDVIPLNSEGWTVGQETLAAYGLRRFSTDASWSAHYIQNLSGLIWLLPAPLLVALLHTRATFGAGMISNWKLDRQTQIMTRLQAIVAQLTQFSVQPTLQHIDETISDPGKIGDLKARLDAMHNQLREKRHSAQRTFQMNSGVAASLMLLALVFQSVAFLFPEDSAARLDFEPIALRIAQDQSSDACQDLTVSNVADAETTQTLLLAHMLRCLQMAQAETRELTNLLIAQRVIATPAAAAPTITPSAPHVYDALQDDDYWTIKDRWLNTLIERPARAQLATGRLCKDARTLMSARAGDCALEGRASPPVTVQNLRHTD